MIALEPDGGDDLAVLQRVVMLRMIARQPVEVRKRDVAAAVRSLDLDGRGKGCERHAHV